MTSTDILLKLSAHILILLDNPQKIIEAQKEEEVRLKKRYGSRNGYVCEPDE